MGSRKGLNLLLALVTGALGAATFACSAPPPQKTPLVVCEAGEDGCPSEKPKTAKQPSKKSSDEDADEGPSGTPTPAPSPDTDDPPPDTAPEPEPAPGPICTQLQGCCAQLQAAGYSPATCQEIVDTRSETACSLQYKQYKDFGDCS